MSHVSYKCADNNTALNNMLSPPTYVHGKCSKCASDVKRMYVFTHCLPKATARAGARSNAMKTHWSVVGQKRGIKYFLSYGV